MHLFGMRRVHKVQHAARSAARASGALAAAADAAAAHAAAALSTGANRAAHLEPTRRLHYTGVDVFDV